MSQQRGRRTMMSLAPSDNVKIIMESPKPRGRPGRNEDAETSLAMPTKQMMASHSKPKPRRRSRTRSTKRSGSRKPSKTRKRSGSRTKKRSTSRRRSGSRKRRA